MNMKYQIRNSPFYIYYRRNLLWIGIFFLLWVVFLIVDLLQPQINDKVAFLFPAVIIMTSLTGTAAFYYLYRFLSLKMMKFEPVKTIAVGSVKNKTVGLYSLVIYLRVDGKETKCITPAIFAERGKNFPVRDYLNVNLIVGYSRQWNRAIVLGFAAE